MKLTELEPQFIKIIDHGHWQEVDTIAEAQGIQFLCPKCFIENKGNVGTHSCVCWWTGVSQDEDPKPGRWNPQGTGYDDLTFVPPGSTSVLLTSGCMAHFNVVNGEIRMC